MPVSSTVWCIVDVQVALGLDREVDQAVAGDLVEHVVEEADAGGDLGRAGAVEVDVDLDRGLLGLALDRGAAHRKLLQHRARHVLALPVPKAVGRL